MNVVWYKPRLALDSWHHLQLFSNRNNNPNGSNRLCGMWEHMLYKRCESAHSVAYSMQNGSCKCMGATSYLEYSTGGYTRQYFQGYECLLGNTNIAI